jgi:hypothetical protein
MTARVCLYNQHGCAFVRVHIRSRISILNIRNLNINWMGQVAASHACWCAVGSTAGNDQTKRSTVGNILISCKFLLGYTDQMQGIKSQKGRRGIKGALLGTVGKSGPFKRETTISPQVGT